MPTLSGHRDVFSAIVLTHLQTQMPAAEWARLRELAAAPSPLPLQTARRDRMLIKTPEQLVRVALSSDGISVSTLLDAFPEDQEEIANIEGEPVYFFRHNGIYAWGPSGNEGYSLSLWVTHPAYPPGW